MPSFWNLLTAPLSQVTGSGSPYANRLDQDVPFVAAPSAAGIQAAAPTAGLPDPAGGSSDVAAPTQPRPVTFWDLLPATPYGRPFVPSAHAPDQYAESVVKARPVMPGARYFSPVSDRGMLGLLPPVVAPAVAGETLRDAAMGRLAMMLPWTTGPLAGAMLLAMTEPVGDSTRHFAAAPAPGEKNQPRTVVQIGYAPSAEGPTREDPEYRPQYVLRGGQSMPKNLRVDNLAVFGRPNDYGISSASAPSMTPDQIAQRAQFGNGQITYTIKRAINGLGFPVEPTGSQVRLHHSIVLPPGQDDLSDAQRGALSTLFRLNQMPNLYKPPR